jgi:hypothetical protein
MNDTPYDRFELNLYQPNAQKLKQWSDCVIFMDWDVRVVENRSGKARGIGGRTRTLFTQHCAAFDAKSRVSLPEKLPAEFGALVPLFGSPQKEVETKSPGASAPASEDSTALLSSRNVELYHKLLDSVGKMENADVVAYLVGRKLILHGGSIDDLSDNQARWIVDHAAKFQEQVQKFRTQPY